MKKHEEYQDSGIEWLGELPAHWEVKRNKFCFSYKKGKMPLSTTDIAGDDTPVYLAMDYLRGNPKQILYVDKLDGATIVNDGDMLLLWDGSNAGEFVPARAGVLSSTMAHLTINADIDKRFAWYFLKAFEPQLKSATIGMGIPHVDGEELMNGSFIVPPLPEQRAIAAYLDQKTAQLDTLLAQKETLLQKLHQKRQALINEAVTQGLGPAAPRKPSGVPWLRNVPAHWEVKKLKYVAGLNSGNTITSETIEPEGPYPVLGGNGLRGYTSTFTHDGHYALIGRQGHLCGNINYGTGQFFATEHALVVSLKGEYETVWLGELLRTMDLGQYSQAAAQPGLSAERLMKLDIPVPPLKEQQAIVRFIEAKTSKINEAAEAIHTQIKTLKAYRQSLISEVVTGKVDVRPAVLAPEADLPLWQQ